MLLILTHTYTPRSFTQRPSASRASGDDGTDTNADNPTDKVNIHKQIKVVHSQNQRLVFLQPEPDYWIVAVGSHLLL
jgi:hypothetical protein